MHRHRERSFHFDTNYVDHGHMARYVVSSELVLLVNNNDSCLYNKSHSQTTSTASICVYVGVFHAMDLDYKMPSPLPPLATDVTTPPQTKEGSRGGGGR